MWPQVPFRAKRATTPYVLLLLVLLFVADQADLIDLAQASAAPPTRPASRPSRAARADIPRRMLSHYRHACRGEVWRTAKGQRYACWAVLAGISKVESDHGRSHAPGVRSGVNRFGCCAGPMQFNLRNGPPSTWDRYGHGSPYRAVNAVPAARRLLVADGARHHLDQALHAYNHSWAYVARVLALARRYQH